ncbi:phage minor head protein [Flavobacterium facile]|uniref:phage minor head protein n=1 Tax=Flavobacterium facile TaxID=2893174 RepID=UPI002E7A3952|nr:phage minor head protein [Flavobacterium sp. T-12]
MYDGNLKPSDLNEELLTKTLKDLREGLASGYGDEFGNYETNAVRTLKLNQHLYRFSGAKTYQEIAKLNFFLKDKPSFEDFKREALKINQEYNKRHLETEYNTAKRSGVMSEKWVKYVEQKDVYPNLKYKTANDSRVREQHRNQQDIIKPINDVFWLSWYPPNDFGCRCYVTQTDEKVTEGIPKENPSPGFNNNVGVSNMIFDENEHPYFVFPASDTKKIKTSFEDLKLSNPDYQIAYKAKKSILEVSTWSDLKDFEINIKNAKLVVAHLSLDIKMRPHSEIKNLKNPEYSINDKIADLKIPIGKGYKNILKKAAEQRCEYVVVSLELNNQTLGEARHLMRNILKQKGVHPTIKTVIIISKQEKVYKYNREEI